MKTHWKKMTDTNYLGSWDIEEGTKLVLKIKEVKEEMLKPSPQAPEEKCIVAYFENKKPMILNKTNCKAIQKRTGSGYIEDWIGQDITIAVQKIKAFGDMVDALRVESFAPKPKAKSNFKEGGFEKALDAVFNGNMTAEKIASTYNLTAEQSKQLKEAEQTFKNKK
jgi:hypothetical protein